MQLDADSLRKFVERDAHQVSIVGHQAAYHRHQLLACMILQNGMRGIFSQFSGFSFEVHGLFLRLLPELIFGAVREDLGALFHEDAVDL